MGGTTDPSGVSSSSGDPPSAEEFAAMCSAITDEAECEAMGSDDGMGGGLACNWETWVSVTLVDGECTFGEVQAACAFESYGSDGCASWTGCGYGLYAGVRTADDGTLELGTSPQGWCIGPLGGACGSSPAEENPPECACACDEAWPGA